MARRIRYSELETRAARDRLRAGKYHHRALAPGKLAIGYRRAKKGLPGIWYKREYMGTDARGIGRYRATQLGLADDYADADGVNVLSYAQALLKAQDTGKPNRSTITVEDGIRSYIKWLKAHRATGDDAERRAAKHILPVLGKIRLADLTAARIVSWRDRLAEQPALVRTPAGKEQNVKRHINMRARKATVNRVLSTLKAALTRAFEAELIDDDTAWRRVKPFHKVTAARPDYLSVEQATRLINAADADDGFRALVHGALLTGCRYSELCALRCRHYARGKLHIAQSKSGHPRDVTLTPEGARFFADLTVGRPGDAFMFLHADGRAWGQSEQSRPMRAACVRAGIKPLVGFHALRHSFASAAVMSGMPLMVLARQLGHRSTKMIELHYGHLADTYIDDAVREHAPRYGAVQPSNVRPLRGDRR